MKATLLSSALLLIAPVAAAQMVVVGEGAAHSCYQSALTGNPGTMGAIKTCTRAIEQDFLAKRDEAATRVNRGVLLTRKGDYEKAEADYDVALKIFPDLPEAHINYGVTLYHQNRLTEAKASFDTALEIGSEKDALALFNRGLIHERQDNAPAAYRDYKAASELMPEWDQPIEAMSRFTVTRRTS
ncbi:MAG: tetratricopeptide repeat protein [Pseudomonadota bacterium]